MRYAGPTVFKNAIGAVCQRLASNYDRVGEPTIIVGGEVYGNVNNGRIRIFTGADERKKIEGEIANYYKLIGELRTNPPKNRRILDRKIRQVSAFTIKLDSTSKSQFGDSGGIYRGREDAIFIPYVAATNLHLSHLAELLGTPTTNPQHEKDKPLLHELVHWSLGDTTPHTEYRTHFTALHGGKAYPIILHVDEGQRGQLGIGKVPSTPQAKTPDEKKDDPLPPQEEDPSPPAKRFLASYDQRIDVLDVHAFEEGLAFTVGGTSREFFEGVDLRSTTFLGYFDHFQRYVANHSIQDAIKHAREIIEKAWATGKPANELVEI